MRLFVAAEPSSAVRAAAVSCGERLGDRLARVGALTSVRWIRAEQLHLTVWFLGEISDARAAAVLAALRPPLGTPAFELHVRGLGAFPPSGSPRVLWMGVARGVAELAQAHDEIGARLQPWGFAPEGRAYSAHLTLARIKEPMDRSARRALREILAGEPADAGRCHIDALTVFKSRTSPRGAVYEPLLRVPLS